MLSPKQFANPAKVHFVSPAGSDVHTVTADCVVPHLEDTSFYRARKCVAIPSESDLTLGAIQASHPGSEKPFFYLASREGGGDF